MLDRLKNRLGDAVKKIARSPGVDRDLIKALAKDIQRALLEAGVDVRLVFKITCRLQERAINETPPPGLSRKSHIIKTPYDELAKMVGTESDFDFAPGVQNKLVLLGMQGSGKTTTAAKLARLLTGQGYKVGVIGADTYIPPPRPDTAAWPSRGAGVIGADTYRPGALVQLRTMCERSNVEVYGEENSKDSPGIVGNGLRHFGRQQLDIIIIDTAGRHKEEKEMLEEMDRIRSVAEPSRAGPGAARHRRDHRYAVLQAGGGVPQDRPGGRHHSDKAGQLLKGGRGAGRIGGHGGQDHVHWDRRAHLRPGKVLAHAVRGKAAGRGRRNGCRGRFEIADAELVYGDV